MNWLAHLFLSPADPACRIGNLLPDMLPVHSLADLPAAFQGGIALHRRIDAFTDRHPVVRQSIQRLQPARRRFGGILCDMFYDHFLARDWAAYSPEPLEEFAAGVYGSFAQFSDVLPAEISIRLERMRDGDLLGSYQNVSGIAAALERISARLRRPVDLAASIADLEQHYELLHSDFRAFFPELQSHADDFHRTA